MLFPLLTLAASFPTDGRKFYVPWDPTYYQAGAALIRNHVGVAFNISLWIFIIILVILLIFRIVGRFGRK